MRAQTRIRHLAHVRLVHQAHVDFDFEDIGGQIDGTDLLTRHVVNWYFHDYDSSDAAHLAVLASLLDQKDTALRARHGAAHGEHVLFRIDRDYLKILDRDSLTTHTPSHAHTLHYAAWRRGCADRAR